MSRQKKKNKQAETQKDSSFRESLKNFDDYFLNIYQDRWQNLREALMQPESMICRINQFLSEDEKNVLKKRHDVVSITCGNKIDYFSHSESYKPERSSSGLLESYVMDLASVFPPLMCFLENEKLGQPLNVLDMCAAPGGKTLLLAEAIGLDSTLIANELSENRRERLTQVLRQYVPQDFRQQIFVKGKDGGLYGVKEPNHYDVILLDAPCSGERYFLRGDKGSMEWTLKSAKGLAQRQHNLLCSAHLALKPGGRIVYSTCSINPLENDQAITNVLKKRHDLSPVKFDSKLNLINGTEETRYGFQFLPDRSGVGPIYFSVLVKDRDQV